MKDHFDRHQERLTDEERRRVLAQAREAATLGAAKRVPPAGEAGFRRWAVSFAIAVTVTVTAAVILIVRNNEERPAPPSRGKPFEIIGEIPAVPATKTSTDLQASIEAGERAGTEPFIDAASDSLSFFAVHVGGESYRTAREEIRAGRLPPPGQVRVEEFVNAFGQGYPDFADADLRVFADGAPAPFGDGTLLLRVGIRARSVNPTSDDTIAARNVSAAVTFDSRRVQSYRLLGFRGEKGMPSGRNVVTAGYEVAALYEIHPVKGTAPGRLATVHVRYQLPGRREPHEVDRPVLSSDIEGDYALAHARLRLDATVARFADILRAPSSRGRAEALEDLMPMAAELSEELRADPEVGELSGLVQAAARLSRGSS
jgi:hypothetical protein